MFVKSLRKGRGSDFLRILSGLIGSGSLQNPVASRVFRGSEQEMLILTEALATKGGS